MRLLSGKYETPAWLKHDSATKEILSPTTNKIILLDPSETYRPENGSGKSTEQFREFDEQKAKHDPIMGRVYETYSKMHRCQTVDFVKRKHKQWLNFDHAEYTIMEALEVLNNFIDESDPDMDAGNSYHGFQTAEMIRKVHPDEDWFQLTGLIHDIGKLLFFHGEEQFATTGDTFPVGCLPADSIPFRNSTFVGNPDLQDPRYNTKLGMYTDSCGLSNLLMSWGHDEYMYQVLKHHPKCTLPREALHVIRFHSFYPWHSAGEYGYFMDDCDRELYFWMKEFNKFDLYTKDHDLPDIDELKEYYQGLVDKYVPGPIAF